MTCAAVGWYHPCWQLESLDFTKLLKEGTQVTIQVIDLAITREALEVEVVPGEVTHRFQVLFFQIVRTVLSLHALKDFQLLGSVGSFSLELGEVGES